MVYSARWFVLSLALCYFLVFFSHYSIAITSLGEERELILIAFRPWGGGGGVHNLDVCAEWPPFSARPWLAPIFQQKVYDWPHFFWIVYERSHFSDVSWYMHIFLIQRLLVLLVFNELTAIFVKLPATNGYKNSEGQYMNRSTFQTD